MPSFLWQGNLPNRGSTIKRLLACHDIDLHRSSVKLHLCILSSTVYAANNLGPLLTMQFLQDFHKYPHLCTEYLDWLLCHLEMD
jgi:hypothetical protein